MPVGVPFGCDDVEGTCNILDGCADSDRPGIDLDPLEGGLPVYPRFFELVKEHRVLPVVDNCIAKEDKDGLNAGGDGLFDSLSEVDFGINVVINIEGMWGVFLCPLASRMPGLRESGVSYLKRTFVLPRLGCHLRRSI